jgi:hypothetical protein
VLAALLQWTGWPGFFAVLAVYGIGQLLEAYVLIPYLVGDRIGLHPLAVIFALLAFGQLFGFAACCSRFRRRRRCSSACVTCAWRISLRPFTARRNR